MPTCAEPVNETCFAHSRGLCSTPPCHPPRPDGLRRRTPTTPRPPIARAHTPPLLRSAPCPVLGVRPNSVRPNNHLSPAANRRGSAPAGRG
eukprot:6244102-Prymnesium_polylepis.1